MARRRVPRDLPRDLGPGWEWAELSLDGRRLCYRRSTTAASGTPIVHLHGFAISGSYLMPTARRLTGRAPNLVPDLPGYGRSEQPRGAALGIPALAERVMRLLDELGLGRVVLVGNSMGCPVGLEVAHLEPERVEGLVLVSPAGGVHNQPLPRALVQLARDGVRERPAMARVAVPDYLRFGPVNALHLFSELTRFPSLERMIRNPVRTLAVLGERDPLMPPPHRVREVASLVPPTVTVAVVAGAAHAMNFSHPGELAHAIGQWLDGEEITDDPGEPGVVRVPPRS